MQCNKPIRTVDKNVRPCLCDDGHAGGCNPFSPNPYMAVVLAKKELPKRDKMPLPKPGVIHTDLSTVQRCLWQGAHGRCIYEISEQTHEHKEETSHVD